jgi:peptidylprolyl isomerase
MLKKNNLLALLLVLILSIYFSFLGCDSGGKSDSDAATADTVTTTSGLKYIDVVVAAGEKSKAGDVATVHYTGWLTDSTKFDSSRDRNQPFKVSIGQGSVIPGWDEGLQGMAIGSKRTLIIPPELGYGARSAGSIPPNSTLIFEVEMLDISEPRKIPEYDEANLQTTESGLQYVITQEGTGAIPQKGQTVEVHYSGWLVDGKMFDSSVDRGAPIQFPLGTGRVIPGWDEGLAMMKVGGKRILVIPSELAYGAGGRGAIPPNSILIFEVELLGVK